MTSKTFKSVLGTTELEVCEYADSHAGLFVSDEDGEELSGFYFDPSTAPALALAILEAAWVESPYYNLKDAVDNLRQHVEREARHAAEAEVQAKLEAEALEFFNEFRVAAQLEPIDSWAEAHPLAQEQWLAVARKAREINKEEK